MAKNNITAAKQQVSKPEPEVKLTRTAFLITIWVSVASFVAQLLMAFIVYPQLPATIPSGWLGSSEPYNPVSKLWVFGFFTVGTLILLGIAYFSPRDEKGQLVMDSSKAGTIIVLALLFTALQSTAFHLTKML
jgi:energy-coupling factor transporter transmembrane protein EcfT